MIVLRPLVSAANVHTPASHESASFVATSTEQGVANITLQQRSPSLTSLVDDIMPMTIEFTHERERAPNQFVGVQYEIHGRRDNAVVVCRSSTEVDNRRSNGTSE